MNNQYIIGPFATGYIQDIYRIYIGYIQDISESSKNIVGDLSENSSYYWQGLELAKTQIFLKIRLDGIESFLASSYIVTKDAFNGFSLLVMGEKGRNQL